MTFSEWHLYISNVIGMDLIAAVIVESFKGNL